MFSTERSWFWLYLTNVLFFIICNMISVFFAVLFLRFFTFWFNNINSIWSNWMHNCFVLGRKKNYRSIRVFFPNYFLVFFFGIAANVCSVACLCLSLEMPRLDCCDFYAVWMVLFSLTSPTAQTSITSFCCWFFFLVSARFVLLFTSASVNTQIFIPKC